MAKVSMVVKNNRKKNTTPNNILNKVSSLEDVPTKIKIDLSSISYLVIFPKHLKLPNSGTRLIESLLSSYVK